MGWCILIGGLDGRTPRRSRMLRAASLQVCCELIRVGSCLKEQYNAEVRSLRLDGWGGHPQKFATKPTGLTYMLRRFQDNLRVFSAARLLISTPHLQLLAGCLQLETLTLRFPGNFDLAASGDFNPILACKALTSLHIYGSQDAYCTFRVALSSIASLTELHLSNAAFPIDVLCTMFHVDCFPKLSQLHLESCELMLQSTEDIRTKLGTVLQSRAALTNLKLTGLSHLDWWILLLHPAACIRWLQLSLRSDLDKAPLKRACLALKKLHREVSRIEFVVFTPPLFNIPRNAVAKAFEGLSRLKLIESEG
jgi:hypothetical protein